MAAGMGSRFGGLKQLNKFGKDKKTLLDFAVEDAISAGFSEVCFVIRRDIEEAFKSEVSKKYEGKIEVPHAFQSLESLPLRESQWREPQEGAGRRGAKSAASGSCWGEGGRAGGLLGHTTSGQLSPRGRAGPGHV